MKWVTWENVGVDRMACAWLIRRSIDPKAKFLFIPKGQQDLPKGAEPFDIPGVRLSHHRGHCSFHTLLGEYKLDDPVLKRTEEACGSQRGSTICFHRIRRRSRAPNVRSE